MNVDIQGWLFFVEMDLDGIKLRQWLHRLGF